jgi:IclR family pca regulon transcriptional regulator
MASDDDAPREIVQAVDRCFAVIKAFGRERRKLTQIQVAEASRLSRATARRFLQTLELLGYVRREGRYYSLQPRMLDLGYA